MPAFGLYALPTYHPGRHGSVADFYGATLDLFVEAEERGFSSGWVNEHHFHPYGGMIPAPAVLLGALAQRTRRLRLGTSVALLPLHHPVEVAEAYAMVDQLSGGRLDLGIGRGFVEHDYATMGVAFGEGASRLEEALEVIRGLWAGPGFPGHSGRHFSVGATDLWPQPAQRPHPPLWAAASANPLSFERWGRAGLNLLTAAYLHPLEEGGRLVARWRDAAAGAGFHGLRHGTHVMVYCDEDGARARRVGAASLAAYRSQAASARSGGAALRAGEPFEELVEGARLVVGDPPDCVAALGRIFAALGADSADCAFSWGDLSSEGARRSFELFSNEVLPALTG